MEKKKERSVKEKNGFSWIAIALLFPISLIFLAILLPKTFGNEINNLQNDVDNTIITPPETLTFDNTSTNITRNLNIPKKANVTFAQTNLSGYPTYEIQSSNSSIANFSKEDENRDFNISEVTDPASVNITFTGTESIEGAVCGSCVNNVHTFIFSIYQNGELVNDTFRIAQGFNCLTDLEPSTDSIPLNGTGSDNNISVSMTSFSSCGRNAANFNITVYYKSAELINITNPFLEVGTPDGIYEWNVFENFTIENNQTEDISNAINTYLETCTPVENNCTIPFLFSSETEGQIKYSDLNITFFNNPANITWNGFNNLTNTLSSSSNTSFQIQIVQEENGLSTYTPSSDLNTTVFTEVNFNPSPLPVEGSDILNVSIIVNASSDNDGLYIGNFTFTRSEDGALFYFPYQLTTATSLAIISFNDTQGWNAVMNSDQTSSRNVNLTNTGNYNCTSITLSITKGGSTGNLQSFMTYNTSDIILNDSDSVEIPVDIVQPSTGLYSGEILTATCTGSAGGNLVTTSEGIEMTFTISNPPTPPASGGGGGTVIITETLKAVGETCDLDSECATNICDSVNKKCVLTSCGNGMCEKDRNESQDSCLQDCGLLSQGAFGKVLSAAPFLIGIGILLVLFGEDFKFKKKKKDINRRIRK